MVNSSFNDEIRDKYGVSREEFERLAEKAKSQNPTDSLGQPIDEIGAPFTI